MVIILYPLRNRTTLIISCDERDRNAVKAIQYPKLIVEVLSPSTETYNRKDKFALYRQSSTLEEYILVDSEGISVECYRRSGTRRWIYEPYTAEDTIALENIEFTCAIARLYEGVIFSSSSNFGS